MIDFVRPLRTAVLASLFTLLTLAGCGGGGGGGGGDGNSSQAPPPAAAITTQPTDQSAVAGTSVTFTVTATNATGYQWQRSSDGGGSFVDLAGATGASNTTAATTLADNGAQYRVVVSGSAGRVTSNPARLTVNAAATAPAFTTQPASATITAGQNAQFTVATSGSPTPDIQWQLSTDNGANWSNIVGATGPVFDVLNAAQANNGRQFRAVSSNSAGTANSNPAVLTVMASSALTIETETLLPLGVPNQPYSALLTAAGGTPPYFWSTPGASILQSYGVSLNPTTGQISGTPTSAVIINFFVDVSDSSITPQLTQKDFSLRIEAPCDSGLGSATVAGAPNTVEGKFCPQTKVLPGVPTATGLVGVAWLDNQPGPRIFKSIGVQFYAATGEIASVSFNLNDPTRLWTYQCLPGVSINYPTCSGVTLDTTTGTLAFVNTLVGSGTSPPFTLNGTLRY